MVKYCRFCGHPFNATNGRKICFSPECQEKQKDEYRKADRNRRRPQKYLTNCPICGVEFIAKSTQLYCGEICRAKSVNMKHAGKEIPVMERIPCDYVRSPHKSKTNHIDIVLRECKKQGITYSEMQKRKTIEQFAKVEI